MLCSIYFSFHQDFLTLLYHTASLQGKALNSVDVAHTLHDSRGVFLFIRELKCNTTCLFCFWRKGPLMGRGLLIHEVSRSHSDTPQSVGLLWTRDRFAAETSI